MSGEQRTPEKEAKFITEALFDDPYATLPVSGSLISPYFEAMAPADAWAEYRQISRLPEGMRLRDIMERMEEDR